MSEDVIGHPKNERKKIGCGTGKEERGQGKTSE